MLRLNLHPLASLLACTGGFVVLCSLVSALMRRLSLNEFNLAYTTPRVVRIQDTYLSLLALLLNLVVFAYIGVYEVVLKKGYLVCYPVSVKGRKLDVSPGVPAMLSVECERINRTRSDAMKNAASVNFMGTFVNKVSKKTPEHCAGNVPADNHYTCFEMDTGTNDGKEVKELPSGIVELPLSQLVTFKNKTTVSWRAATVSSAIVFANDFVATTQPYEARKNKDPKLGGSLENFRVRLVDLDGNVVNACPRFVQHRTFRLADTCDDLDTLEFNQPCEFEPGDTHAIPLIAIAKAGGAEHMYTKVKDMHPTVSSSLIDGCVENLVGNKLYGAYVYKDGYADFHAAGIPQKYMRIATGADFNEDISTYDLYLKRARKLCADNELMFGGVAIQMDWTLSNVEFSRYNAEFDITVPKAPVAVEIKVKFSPPSRANGLIGDGYVSPNHKNWPKTDEDVQEARWFGTTLSTAFLGELCEFSLTHLIITLTASIGMLAIATIITELFMLKVSPLRELYNAEKIVTSGDYTQLRKTMTSKEMDDVLHSDDMQMSALGKSLSLRARQKSTFESVDEESTPVKVHDNYTSVALSSPHAAKDIKRAIEGAAVPSKPDVARTSKSPQRIHPLSLSSP